MLPCLVSTSITLCSIILCALFVNETLPSIVAKKRIQAQSELDPSTSQALIASSTHSSPTITDSSLSPSPSARPVTPSSQSQSEPQSQVTINENQTEPQVIKRLLSQSHIRAVLGSAFMISFLNIGFDALFALYSYTSIALGGIGRSVRIILFSLSFSIRKRSH